MKRTANLGIFQYQPEIDGKEVFSINKALNENWGILDENFYNLSQSTQNNFQSLNDILDNRTSYYIIETFIGENIWYRKWSDGFIEQGGETTDVKEYITIVLPVAFYRDNYSILITSIYPNGNTSAATEYGGCIYTKSTTQFSYTVQAGKRIFSWYACGY